MTNEPDRFLTPKQVARIFGVDPKTVSRWCREGKLRFIRTPGGHHRIPESVVKEITKT